MTERAANPALVVGYGNTLRGDDGVGPTVAEWITGQNWPGVRSVAVHQLTPELAEELATVSRAVFVDAAVGQEGVRVRPLAPAMQPAGVGHVCDPGWLLALCRTLYGRCPESWLVTVPAVQLEFGEGLSARAERGAQTALRQIAVLLKVNRSPDVAGWPTAPVTRAR